MKCSACDTVSEVFRHHSEHPKTPPCPKCDGATEQIHLPRQVASYAPAVVVYEAPDGFRYPGDGNGKSAANYEKLGYKRIEARGWAEVRSLEKKLNAHERTVMEKTVERQQARHEAATSQRRSAVWEGLKNGFQLPVVDEKGRPTGRMKTVHMTAAGRAIMDASMRRNDGKPGPQMRDPGTFVEAYSYTRSNRDESRGSDGRRRND